MLSSSRILDIVGLASQPVADLKRRRALDAAALGRLADERGVEAIALYEEVFSTILPASWIKVGEWTIPHNVAVSGDTVAFFTETRRTRNDCACAWTLTRSTCRRASHGRQISARTPANAGN